MPRLSERQQLMGQMDRLLKMMAIFGDDKTDDYEEILDLRAHLASCRYMNLAQHIRKNKTMNEMLWFYGDREFKQLVRMNKSSFEMLVDLLGQNPIFGSTNQRHKHRHLCGHNC